MRAGARGGLLARLAGVGLGLGLGIGPGRVVVVDGVRYRERKARARAGIAGGRGLLGGNEPGVREYEVRFPGSDRRRRPMRIRATPARVYDDLTPDPRVGLARVLDAVVRPGERVLELGCGTGGASNHLAYLVGPSGGVVALDRDGESVRFARQRYPSDHLGFELGWLETLTGELDGAFDAVVAVDLFRDAPGVPERDRTVEEVARVLRPGGHLLCLSTSDEPGERARRTLAEQAMDQVGAPARGVGGWRGSLWRKPAPQPPQSPPQSPSHPPQRPPSGPPQSPYDRA